jgi:hypothetical protein
MSVLRGNVKPLEGKAVEEENIKLKNNLERL